MDIYHEKNEEGNKVIQYDLHLKNNQQWRFRILPQ